MKQANSSDCFNADAAYIDKFDVSHGISLYSASRLNPDGFVKLINRALARGKPLTDDEIDDFNKKLELALPPDAHY